MSPAPAVTVINAKAVIDGTGANPLENAAVVVEGSTIKAVVRQGQGSRFPKALTYGRWIFPTDISCPD